ncbi:haloacid dehalogenase type II [Halomonas sp. HMF6819]|uniref:haloacid dehalogenase type II n=1 Tax=Halomonas sp. HMF6819 TaxID=3373085 RepID=UPI0037AA047C
MDRVRKGEIPWTILYEMHHESLNQLLDQHDITSDEVTIDHINLFWHRLEPWPGVQCGLTQLKGDYITSTLTEGNASLVIDVALHIDLPWDMFFCAALFEYYKPNAEVCLGTCRLLNLPPAEVMLSAAHNADLRTAKALCMKTTLIARPEEYRSEQQNNLEAEEARNCVAKDLVSLGKQVSE